MNVKQISAFDRFSAQMNRIPDFGAALAFDAPPTLSTLRQSEIAKTFRATVLENAKKELSAFKLGSQDLFEDSEPLKEKDFDPVITYTLYKSGDNKFYFSLHARYGAVGDFSLYEIDKNGKILDADISSLTDFDEETGSMVLKKSNTALALKEIKRNEETLKLPKKG